MPGMQLEPLLLHLIWSFSCAQPKLSKAIHLWGPVGKCREYASENWNFSTMSSQPALEPVSYFLWVCMTMATFDKCGCKGGYSGSKQFVSKGLLLHSSASHARIYSVWSILFSKTLLWNAIKVFSTTIIQLSGASCNPLVRFSAKIKIQMVICIYRE